MPTPVENYIFNELPRRFVADSSLATGSSLTASWLLVATGNGFQVNLVDPATLGFEPEVVAGNDTQYYRGDKTWATLNAAAVGAIASSEKGQALGVATLDADGYVELSQINPAVIERVVVVADEAARYALTTAQVQNGDVVNQQLDGNNDPNPSMWFVYDDTNLDNSSGYLPFSAGVAASVQWSGVSGKPAIIGDLEAITNPNDTDILWFQGGSLVVTDIGTLKTELALGISDIEDLQDDLDGKQDQAEILDRLSELPAQDNSFGILVRDTDGYFQGREVVGTKGITVTEGDGNADNISIGLEEVGTAGTYGDDDNFPVYEVNAYGQVTGTTTKSLVKDTLTLLDQVADQTLVANTTYEIGEYTNTLNLLMPDPVPGGTTVTLAVPMILAAPVGDITVVFPTGKELFGFLSSIPLKATLDPLPGDRIVFTYSSNASKWVFYKTQSLYQKRLYLVGTSSSNPTLDPHIHHSFISNATTNRSISIPDTDIDLSAVGQTEFFTSEFVLKDSTTPTKEIGFNASQISGGQTRIISMPDADVDLGNITEVLNVAAAESISVEANRNYHIVASGSFTINADMLSAGNIVQITSVLDSSASAITVTFSGISSYFSEVGGSAGSAKLYPASSITLWRKTSGVFYRRTGVQFAAEFMLRKDGNSSLRTTFDNSAITNNRSVAFPDKNVDLGKILVIDNVTTNSVFTVSANTSHLIYASSSFTLNCALLATGTSNHGVELINNSNNTITITLDTGTTFKTVSGTTITSVTIYRGGGYRFYRSSTNIICYELGVLDSQSFKIRQNTTDFVTSFNNSAITSSNTITIPNANVNLGNVAQAATGSINGYLSSTDWTTFNNKKSLPEIKSASFTAEINKAYSLGTPTATLNIQFPTGTVTGQEIVTHINRAALTYTVFAVPAAGQHVAYVGAGTYQIVSGFCDHILRWVFNSSNSAWELLEIVPAGSITDTITFCSTTNIQSRLKLNLPTATGTYQWYTPAKNINFGDLPSVATNDTNSIALAALRCRILGGSGNTVSGTGNVVINSTSATLSTTTNTTFINSLWSISGSQSGIVAVGVRNNFMQTQPLDNTIAIGSANNNDLFTYPVAACTANNSLFASSDSVPVSGTLYATTNGSQTLSSANCLPAPTNGGTAQYEVDFIVSVGAVGLASTACNATGCIAMRRIFTVFKNNSGAAVLSTVDTVGTDRTLGAIGGTFTPTIALSGTTHVTVGITRASGAAGQEAMAISCRVRAHLTR